MGSKCKSSQNKTELWPGLETCWLCLGDISEMCGEHPVQYSTVQYSTVQYSTVQYSTVQYSTVQCN